MKPPEELRCTSNCSELLLHAWWRTPGVYGQMIDVQDSICRSYPGLETSLQGFGYVKLCPLLKPPDSSTLEHGPASGTGITTRYTSARTACTPSMQTALNHQLLRSSQKVCPGCKASEKDHHNASGVQAREAQAYLTDLARDGVLVPSKFRYLALRPQSPEPEERNQQPDRKI